MNAGFRNLLGRRDATRFKAYLLAIAVQMLLLPILQIFGLAQITAPAFYPLGATLGGFIFGMAMDWGGGCAAGVWYKLGAGNIGAFIAIIGLSLGYITVEAGALKALRVFIQSVHFDSITLGTLLGLSFWSMSMPLALLLIFFLQKKS